MAIEWYEIGRVAKDGSVGGRVWSKREVRKGTLGRVIYVVGLPRIIQETTHVAGKE